MTKVPTLPIVILFFTLGALMVRSQEHILSFEVLEHANGRPLDNAQIAITPCACGGVTDASGKFQISLPVDTYTVTVSYIGFKDEVQAINLDKSIALNIRLVEAEEQLSEVVVRAKRILDNILF